MEKYWKKLKKSLGKRLPSWLAEALGWKEKEAKWNEGKMAFDAEDSDNCEFEVECSDQDMSRPSGEPERIWILVVLRDPDSKWKSYGMINGRDFVRVRSKGHLDIHVSGSVYGPIPKGVFKQRIKVQNRKIEYFINDTRCDKGCGDIGDAKVEKIIISPDPGRPAGFKWSNATLKKV